MPTYDVAVIGLGMAGSATVYELARRGLRTIGFDRHFPPHTFGSSHGESRVIREAYYEDPIYVPIVQHAYSGWSRLEEECGTTLLHPTGAVMIGPPNGSVTRGTLESARTHALPVRVLEAAELRSSFGGVFFVPDGFCGVFEERAGALLPERSIEAFLECARRRGAELCPGTEVVSFAAEGEGCCVVTRGGHRTLAARVVVAAGGWAPALVPLPRLRIERQVQHWFLPRGDRTRFARGKLPIFLFEEHDGTSWYGLPDLGDGLKCALHHQAELLDPAALGALDREVNERDWHPIEQRLDRYLPDARGRRLRAAVCFYTVTPDAHFVIDHHPQHQRVVIVSACSGHGFKFAPALGEIAADLATGQPPRFDLSLFRLARPALA